MIGGYPLPTSIVLFSCNHYRMIETGSWAVPRLISYLVSIQSTLLPPEIETLQKNPAFPKEATVEQNKNEGSTLKKIPKLKPSDLYEPLDVFRDLGLPIIDWRGKDYKNEWRSDSKEGVPNMI